jgi:hypothetical protein
MLESELLGVVVEICAPQLLGSDTDYPEFY